MMMKKTARLLLILPLFALAGCDIAAMGGGYGLYRYFEDPQVNLREKNYAVADYLDQQLREFIKHN
jgi:hypothetical protein